MKSSMPVIVIAVGKGNHSQQGGSPFSSCDLEDNKQTAPMLAIPVKALEMDTEDGKGAMPEVGDSVELTGVKGTVRKLDSGEAYIEITEVNGLPVESEGMNEKESESSEMSEGDMKKMAMEHDKQMGMEE